MADKIIQTTLLAENWKREQMWEKTHICLKESRELSKTVKNYGLRFWRKLIPEKALTNSRRGNLDTENLSIKVWGMPKRKRYCQPSLNLRPMRMNRKQPRCCRDWSPASNHLDHWLDESDLGRLQSCQKQTQICSRRR